MLLSIVWSDMPMSSFKRWTRELIAVSMALLVLSEREPRKTLEIIFRRIVFILVPFSYVLIHYFPLYGREYNRWTGELMWIGTATQKNGLGLICLTAVFFLTWNFIRRKRNNIDVPRPQALSELLVFVLSLWLMGGPEHILSYSVTSNITLFLGLISLFSLFWLKKRGVIIGRKTLIFSIALIIVYGSVTPFIGKLAILDFTSIFGRDESLTGRNEIWDRLMPYVDSRPLFGHGYGGFWTDEMRQTTDATAHNGYLDIILNMGIVGLFLFALFLISCSRNSHKEMKYNIEWGAFFFSFVLMAVVHNIAESTTVGLYGRLSAFVLILTVTSNAFTLPYANGATT